MRHLKLMSPRGCSRRLIRAPRLSRSFRRVSRPLKRKRLRRSEDQTRRTRMTVKWTENIRKQKVPRFDLSNYASRQQSEHRFPIWWFRLRTRNSSRGSAHHSVPDLHISKRSNGQAALAREVWLVNVRSPLPQQRKRRKSKEQKAMAKSTRGIGGVQVVIR